jgi:hypothetical protein
MCPVLLSAVCLGQVVRHVLQVAMLLVSLVLLLVSRHAQLLFMKMSVMMAAGYCRVLAVDHRRTFVHVVVLLEVTSEQRMLVDRAVGSRWQQVMSVVVLGRWMK